MHYCCLVFTDEFPSDQVITEKLAPFNDEVYYSANDGRPRPMILYDWWQVGGRYSGQIKLTINEDDDFYQWSYILSKPRAGRIFRSKLLEDFSKKEVSFRFYEDELYLSMGYRDGYILVDGAKIRDIGNVDGIGCYCFVDEKNEAHAREYFYGNEFNNVPTFDVELKKAFERNKDGYLCVVDIHD